MNARIGALFVLGLVLLTPSVGAQQATVPPFPSPGPGTPDDAMLVAQGWLLLAQGSAAPAAARAREVLRRSPVSPAAVALLIEAEITRGGSAGGLAEYERWLGGRAHEEPLLLRRVSQALLREVAAQTSDAGARLTALRALSATGDAAAVATLTTAMGDGSHAAARVLAETGNPDAIRYLADGIKSGAVDKASALQSLSKRHTAESVNVALALLDDARAEIRGAAIDALGRMRAREAAARLRPVLNDPRPFLRVSAAAALLAMGDEAGLSLLRELASQDSAPARLAAAEAMADRRDADWVAMVGKLTAASEPEVRLAAARLIGPTDPDRANAVIAALRDDPNPAIRSLASDAAVQSAASSLTRLKTLLHRASLGERVDAAEAILQLTR